MPDGGGIWIDDNSAVLFTTPKSKLALCCGLMEEHRSRSDERFCFLRVMNIQVAESKLAKWLQHTLSGRLHFIDRAYL